VLIPSASQILNVCSDTLQSVVQPTLTDKVAISAAQTMSHLLRHVTLRIESEGQMLFDDAAALRELLARVQGYLDARDDSASLDMATQIATTIASRFRPPEAYPTLESLSTEVKSLREMLNVALEHLHALRESCGEREDYRKVRAAIRAWMKREIEQEERLIEPAFAGLGPRR
jgi:hypothetical protein